MTNQGPFSLILGEDRLRRLRLFANKRQGENLAASLDEKKVTVSSVIRVAIDEYLESEG